MRTQLLLVPALVAITYANQRDPAPTAGVAPTDCVFSPAGPVQIEVGANQLFAGDEELCSGTALEITPANGTVGFWQGTDCNTTQMVTSESGAFKVRGCDEGTVTVLVYRNQSKTVLVQTISIEVIPL